jgi:hypothetical protein
MRLASHAVRRGVVTAILAASAGTALLVPIVARSREIERRAEMLNARLEADSAIRSGGESADFGRAAGTPREVFAWLREIEADPPREGFRIELAIDSSQGSATRLVAEVHRGRRENPR